MKDLCHILDYIIHNGAVFSGQEEVLIPPFKSRPPTTMAARGIGSRNSPIIIDDDDDNFPSPSTAKATLNSSTSPTGATPQEPIYIDSIETHNPTPARRSPPDQLRNGVGYSILVRMGYKPGRGLGVNLEGICPLTAILLGG